MKIIKVTYEKFSQIFNSQNLTYFNEAELLKNHSIHHFKQAFDELRKELGKGVVFIMIDEKNNRVIGSVHVNELNDYVCIKDLNIQPEYQYKRFEHRLLHSIETFLENKNFKIFTNNKSLRNWYLYKRNSYNQLWIQKVSDNSENIEISIEKSLIYGWYFTYKSLIITLGIVLYDRSDIVYC